MSAITNKDEDRDEAKSQLESIVSMVRQLAIETAAEDYLEALPDPKVIQLCDTYGLIEPEDEEKGTTATHFRARLQGMVVNQAADWEGFTWDEEAAREAILNDPIEITYRSDWVSNPSEMAATEACILLSTGGPACRILCDIGQHGELENPRLEYQGWGTPWRPYSLEPFRRYVMDYISFFNIDM